MASLEATAVVAHPPARTVRRTLTWVLPAVATLAWLVYVVAADQLGRIADQWQVAVTMVFGSFVAGSTPQGGGAVAFPVLTKVLEVPAEVARTFSLTIQATGMVMASAIILLAGRRVELRALGLGVAGGVAGFLFGLLALGEPSQLFWPSRIPAPYIKVSFTIAIAALAYIVFLSLRYEKHGQERVENWGSRMTIGLVAFAFVGGAFSSLTGSGVDVFLFLFVVVAGGLHPRIGIPTSVITMAIVSVFGFLILGIGDSQLDVGFDAAGDIDSVGGEPVQPALPADRFDVTGLWLAAVPIVVWGAPLGSWVCSVLRERRLIVFVASMASLEVATTWIFLDDLHSNPALIAYFIYGSVLAIAGITLLNKKRWWFGASTTPAG